MVFGTSKFSKSSLSVLLSLASIIGASSQTSPTPTPCPVENLLGSTIKVVAFEACWKIEFFEGGGIYKDTSASTDCTNNAFSTTPHSTFSPSKSTGNLAIYDIAANLGYDGELILLEDTTLPTNHIEARMTEKLPKSPVFGTYGLTVTFQTCPTPSPSSVPSAPPSSTPSITPTSTCPISEFTGRSFLLSLLNACFKMEIFDGGNIYVDENDRDCTYPKFDTSNPMSYYGGTEDENKAIFTTNGKPGKWSGELFVVQGDADSIKLSSLNIRQKQFQVLQTMTTCVAAPSMSPSILPTDLPSYSSIPSMFPIRDPSAQPSNIHSSLPSLHPSALHPNACASDGFLGRTFKAVVLGECYIFESFTGGQIKVDPTDSTCSKTALHSSTYHVLSQYKENVSNRIVFEKIPGATESSWEGYIQIIKDTKLTQESLELTKLGWYTNELVLLLKVPDCPSSEPSVKPRSKPSISPSSKPSTEPISKDDLKLAIRMFESLTDEQIKDDPLHSSTYVLSQYKQGISNRIVFETTPGATESSWEGHIQIIEDTESTQESLELTKLGWNTSDLVFMLKTHDCPSSEPSNVPSSMRSSEPSSKPSNKPSGVLSSMPSSNPSYKHKPSSVPSSMPSYCKFGAHECGTSNELQRDYRGVVAVTRSGIECQAWDSQEPHKHSHIMEKRVSAGLDKNYCRNPDDEPHGAWCYTINPGVRWEYCDVDDCGCFVPYTAFKSNDELKKAVTDYCNDPDEWKNNPKFITHGPIEDWNTSEITDMSNLFRDKTNCNPYLANWDVSKVTTFYLMFFKASAFNGNISAWDTSKVTNFEAMFHSALSFNGDISEWDTSSATRFRQMFWAARSFIGDISKWDTSSATNFSYMFIGAYRFNGDISEWDTSKVRDFSAMFSGASSFNKDISAWDTSSATNFRQMFSHAYDFNGDISEWDTSKVTNFYEMFNYARSFNQNLCNWNVNSISDARYFCINGASCGGCNWYKVYIH